MTAHPVAAIAVPAEWAPILTMGFVGGIALVMVGMVVSQVRRMRAASGAFDEAFTKLTRWQEDSLAGLCWTGDYSRSSGPFRSRLRFVLNSSRSLRTEDADDDFLLESHRRGPAAFELRTAGLLQPLLVWKRQATLRTRQETLTLELRCGFGIPRLRSARVERDGQWLGDFIVAADGRQIALRDRSGEVVGSWQTGQRPLAFFDTGELRRGALLMRGDHLGDLIVPSLPVWNSSLRSRAVPLLENTHSGITDEQRAWLLAAVALCCYALGVSRGFASRRRCSPPPSGPL